jgi:hypothetical protein
MPETTIQLGQRVEDRVNGFRGIVRMIRADISGCTTVRVEAENDAEPQRDAEDVRLQEDRLTVVDEETEFTGDFKLESSVSLGDKVQSDVTGETGYVFAIGYNRWNCNRIGIKIPNSDQTESAESALMDEPLVSVVEEGAVEPVEADDDDDGNSRSTGAMGGDMGRESMVRQ